MCLVCCNLEHNIFEKCNALFFSGMLQLHVATLQLESFPAVEFFTDVNWLLLK